MYNVLAMINVELGLRICHGPNSSDNFVEVHRRSINRLFMAKKRARTWMIFQSV